MVKKGAGVRPSPKSVQGRGRVGPARSSFGGRRRTERESDEEDPPPDSQDQYQFDSGVCKDGDEDALR